MNVFTKAAHRFLPIGTPVHRPRAGGREFLRCASGNVLIMFGLSAPVLIGCVGLAIDVGSWELAHKSLQRAADSAAISAVVGYQAGVNVTTQAEAVAATYNFTNGVVAYRPPISGPNKGNNGAVEVIISQAQPRIFSGIFGSGSVAESARAVALQSSSACVLALDQSAASAISAQGTISVAANGCSIYSDSNSSTAVSAGGNSSVSALQIGAVGGISGTSNMTAVNGYTHGGVLSDPYANVAMPTITACDYNKFSSKKTETISPGVYCNGFTLNAGANVTMSPGVYIMDQGSFTINGGATLTGTGVTIFFTSSSKSNYATAKIAGGANVNLTAPTSGTYAGIVMLGDRNMPVGTAFDLAGGSSQAFSGAIDISKGAVNYAGGASSFNGCTQVIADTVSFTGNSGLATNCTGMGTKSIGAVAQLVE